MQNIKKIIALILVSAAIITLLPAVNIDKVHAETHDVYQSRWIADIEDFPLSYQAGLTRLKSIYPNAQFIYYDTDLDWYNDILTEDNEMRYGRNLIPSSSPSSWKNTDSKSYDPITNTYTQVEPGWNNASQELVEYYMDPRNFFNEKDIFQFLDLSFTGTETVEGVQAILEPSFMGSKTITDNDGNEVSYAQALYDIGKEVEVSPYLLACRIRQEQGSGTSGLISGTYPGYEGYYNYFNICASGSTTKAIIENGLQTAKSSGWNTRYKSLLGGASVLASNYVNDGKNCLYLQHFNVTAHNNIVNYSIYMANTTAPYYENKMMASSLTDKNAGYTFIIPVYDNMPETPCDLPSGGGNGSYLLKSLSISSVGGEVNIGKFSSYTFRYSATVKGQSFVTLKTNLYSKSSSMLINGIQINLDGKTSMEKAIPISGGFNTITITITAENGVCRDYVIDLINDDGNTYYKSSSIDFNETNAIIESGKSVEELKNNIQTVNCSVLVVNNDGKIKSTDEICLSGDIIMIKNMENQIVYNAPIVILGDIDNDGNVTDNDISILRSHILESYTMTLDEQYRADVNADKNIDVVDMGIIKKMTDGYFGNYVSDISIVPDIPEDIYDNKTANVTIIPSDGTYYIDGYFVYNEGKLLANDVVNDGKIHFIADAESVYFENGKSSINISPIVISGTSDFSIEVIKAYDYSMKKEVIPTTEQSSLNVQNSEISIEIVQNESPTEGDKKYHVATMTVKNIASTSIANVVINLGQYFINNNGDNVINIVGMKPGDSQTIKLILAQGLSSSNYNTEITVQYQDSNGIENITQVPVRFEILNHEHPVNWKISSTNHYMSCETCGDEVNEEHIYFEQSTNVFTCSICGYKKECNISVSQVNVVTGIESEFTPTVIVNGKSVNLENVSIKWYIDGKKVSDSDVLKKKFSAIGYNSIDCVATYEGVVITKSFYVFVQQKDSNVKNPIMVSSVSCNSISMKKYNGYEYKIGNGNWQDSPTFSDLEAGNTYVVYQRQKSTKAYTSIKVQTGHRASSNTYEDICETNTVVKEQCICCKKEITRTIPGTAHNHIFINYETASEATCQSGTIKIAKCVYGCGAEDTKTMSDIKFHQFSKYIYDNNANCVSGGTKTAKCDYGCGNTHSMPADGTPSGHQYIYTENNDATIDTSKTATGICELCGLVNTKTIDGTRLTYVTDIHINVLVINVAGQYQLLVESADDNVIVQSASWHDNNAKINTNNPLIIDVTNGNTFALSELILVADSGHKIYEHANVYVNGKLFNGNIIISENGMMTITDIGQFTF